MRKRRTPPAEFPQKRTYRVLASSMQRFYQDVEATSPENAYASVADGDWILGDFEPGAICRTGDVIDVALGDFFQCS